MPATVDRPLFGHGASAAGRSPILSLYVRGPGPTPARWPRQLRDHELPTRLADRRRLRLPRGRLAEHGPGGRDDPRPPGTQGHAAEGIAATRVCPPYRRRLTRWPVVRRLGPARNADRVLNRFWDYPRALRATAGRGGFDLYHVVDHSYSQLVHVLPPGRSVVTCHDLDTFRCLLDSRSRAASPLQFRAARRAARSMGSGSVRPPSSAT